MTATLQDSSRAWMVRLQHFSTRSRVLSTSIECYRFISWQIIHFRGEKAT